MLQSSHRFEDYTTPCSSEWTAEHRLRRLVCRHCPGRIAANSVSELSGVELCETAVELCLELLAEARQGSARQLVLAVLPLLDGSVVLQPEATESLVAVLLEFGEVELAEFYLTILANQSASVDGDVLASLGLCRLQREEHALAIELLHAAWRAHTLEGDSTGVAQDIQNLAATFLAADELSAAIAVLENHLGTNSDCEFQTNCPTHSTRNLRALCISLQRLQATERFHPQLN